MTHDEAAALKLPCICWHESMTDEGWIAGPIRVEEYRIAPGASVKSFVCLERGRLFQTGVDHIYTTKAEVERLIAEELQGTVANCLNQIQAMHRAIADTKRHPLWKDPK